MQTSCDSVGQRRGVAAGDEQPGSSIGNHVRDAAGAAGHDGQPRGQRFDDRYAQSFPDGNVDEHIRGGQAGRQVGTEPGEVEHARQPERCHARLQRRPQRPVPAQQIVRLVRPAFPDACPKRSSESGGRVDERVGRFARDQGAHRHDQPVGLAQSVPVAHRGASGGAAAESGRVHAAGNQPYGAVGNACGAERVRHPGRNRDDRVDVRPVQPAGSPASRQRIVHASGHDPLDCQIGQPRTQRVGARGVEMHDVVAPAAHEPPQPPAGCGIEMVADRQITDGQLCVTQPAGEAAARRRCHVRRMAGACQIAGQPENLGLAATPVTFRVDVQDAQPGRHALDSGAAPERCSRSLAYLRKT